MKEQLISFDTAILAKEKGFWIESALYYHPDNYTLAQVLNEDRSDCASIVTQSLLQKWLRDEKEIDVEPRVSVIREGYYVLLYVEREPQSLDKLFGKTYEEALEQGLIKALDLL